MATAHAGKTAHRPIATAGKFLAALLLCVSATLAQSNTQNQPSNQDQKPEQDKSGTQSQSTSSDKPAAQNGAEAGKAGGDQSSEPGTARIKINVTGSNDKPVPNASVYVRFNETGGFLHKDKLAEMNFKTNGDGSVKVPDVPQGKVLIQVVAKGWHTYGKWYDVDKAEMTVSIKLEPPPHWY